MSIIQITKTITQLVGLILAGLALADAIEKVAKRTGVSKADVRRVWRSAGMTVSEIRSSGVSKARLVSRMVKRSVGELIA